jgi:ribosome-associated protein
LPLIKWVFKAMRGRDQDTGEFLDESRSQKRREALDVLSMAGKLMEMSHAVLMQVPMPEELRERVLDSQRITSNIARKRQTQFLAKFIRREDDQVLSVLRAALEHTKDDVRREAAALHRVEHWRLRLVNEADVALAEFVALYPDADRQQIRALSRNAKAERAADKPPHAFRELFKVLRELMAEGDAADEGDD